MCCKEVVAWAMQAITRPSLAYTDMLFLAFPLQLDVPARRMQLLYSNMQQEDVTDGDFDEMLMAGHLAKPAAPRPSKCTITPIDEDRFGTTPCKLPCLSYRIVM